MRSMDHMPGGTKFRKALRGREGPTLQIRPITDWPLRNKDHSWKFRYSGRTIEDFESYQI
jgi:hypothetical protein